MFVLIHDRFYSDFDVISAAYPGTGTKSHRLGLKAAPLMCRTKLNKVRLRSDFRATADSDGVLASNLTREACGKQFSIRKFGF